MKATKDSSKQEAKLQQQENLKFPDIASLSISSFSDYHSVSFSGKDVQKEEVIDVLDQQGFIPETLMEQEVDWFYESLGIDDLFFSKESSSSIANIIHTLYAAKVESFAKMRIEGDVDTAASVFTIKKKVVADNHAVFIETGDDLDNEIDAKHLDNSAKSYRLVSYFGDNNLKLVFLYETKYPEKTKQLDAETLIKGEIDPISDVIMSEVTSAENRKLYGQLIHLVSEREGPVIKTFNSIANRDEVRLIVAFRKNTTKSYYSAVTSLLHYYHLKPSKIFIETFANDVVVYSIYLNQSDQQEDVHNLALSIQQVEREASLLYAIPNNFFDDLYRLRQFSPQEAIYAHCGSIFVNHFINRLGSDYHMLVKHLGANQNDTLLLDVLNNLKKKLRNETFTQQIITNVLHKYKEIVSKLYKNFAQIHYITPQSSRLEKTLSYQRMSKLEPFKDDTEFELYLTKFIPNDSPDLLILKTLKLFNESILKTNFFITRKVAISFRLNPSLIMPVAEYSETPYGIFFVVGSTFKGFHIRFRDIARGGIRIVCSRSQDQYDINSKMVVDENYGLASTQQSKNKDIPEGGSKGVVLMNQGLTTQTDTFVAFSQYVDAIIDILIQDPKKEKYVDLFGHQEILFFGPDEGTAGFVNWATNHARKRGCPWWKSFLTGKTADLGGIPHDEYGMTSISVRSYVNKLYETLNLTTTKMNKFQTGGPDGDLGSNEILLSTENENYVAIVDGSGVLCDNRGINKEELRKLAHERKTISKFDRSKLSGSGFFVSVDETDVMLPNGTIVSNGTTFRNRFHMEIFKFVDHIDLFVPCGGRPASIDTNSLHYYIEKTGKCKIPYIVEGANLFISQPAKVALEKRGCILIKDASANKGGVTSSSMEVLASLALNDEDFLAKFVEVDGKRTPLYEAYVEEIQEKIKRNAILEFERLWSLNQERKEPISELSNLLSQTINKLNDDLINSEELWLNDLALRNYLLLNKIIPKLLVDVAGSKAVLENIPVQYLKALLSSYLSSTFVYKYGIDVNIGKFLEFIGELKRDAEGFQLV
ncbi:HGL036Cp [Eremothecium sinecaudum]|uniref:NAD-specific glutamate dehydrogenase n=1 Tax=Eremothecium sinecaudum TaxID=45286 RepID=A0A0X8HVJ3_9SACH|nr:HGL036Cp [Eremothecium sinecaudum]AMD22304.1 HGL036Cp [Eremothecium sinecaudum]